MNETFEPDENLPAAPARVVAAFRRLQAEPVFVPPAVDAALLAAARERFQRPRARRAFAVAALTAWLDSRVPKWLGRRPALATFLAFIVSLGTVALLVVQRQTARQVAKADIDQNGHVDILDAFALSRSLATGAPATSALDVNGDGIVDAQDVAAVTAQAVRLTRSSGS